VTQLQIRENLKMFDTARAYLTENPPRNRGCNKKQKQRRPCCSLPHIQ